LKTSGIFTVHKYQIKVKNKDKPIYIRPFSDVHRTSYNCNEEAWLAWIKESKERLKTHQTYFIGLGDYIDLISSSEKNHFYSRDIHATTKFAFGEMVRHKLRQFCEEINFTKDYLIGLGNGNHYHDMMSGINSDQYLCEMLGTKYLGVASFIRLLFEYKPRTNVKLDIFLHHGLGASSTASSVRKMEELIKWVKADIYLMGHDHRIFNFPKMSIELTDGIGGLRIQEKIHYFIRVGGFLNSYSPNEKYDYNVNVCRNPLILGAPEIEVKLNRVTRLNDKRGGVKRRDRVIPQVRVTT